MLLNKHKFSYSIFFLFFTFCIINGIKHPEMHIIGQYGKIFVLFISLALFAMIFNQIKDDLEVKKEHLLILLLTLLFLLFSFLFYMKTSDLNSFTYSLLFGCYLLFLFITISILNTESEYTFFLRTRNMLVINYLFCFAIAIALNLSMYGQELAGRVGFGGFYSARMGFGLLSAVGFIITFYLYREDKKRTNLLLMFLFLFFVLLSQSRTPQIIIIILLIHLYINSKLKYILILTLPISFYFFISYIDQDNINSLSSGRMFIWNLTLDDIQNNGIFKGYGIYNFNDIILQKYKDYSNFFKLSDEISFHSSFLSIMASGGIVSLFLFIYINYIVYIKSSIIYQSIQIAIIIGSLFESYILSPNMPISLLYWTILFIQISSIKGNNS